MFKKSLLLLRVCSKQSKYFHIEGKKNIFLEYNFYRICSQLLPFFTFFEKTYQAVHYNSLELGQIWLIITGQMKYFYSVCTKNINWVG